MKKVVKISLFVAMGIIFSACSNIYNITYDTKPRCARLICDGKFKGLTPVKLGYDRGGIENGILHTQQCKAVFASGWEGVYDNRIDTTEYYKGLDITITRPQGVGYSQDWDFVCSNACIYSIATRLWNENPYYFSTNRISKYDIFLDFKRDFYYSGTCP